MRITSFLLKLLPILCSSETYSYILFIYASLMVEVVDNSSLNLTARFAGFFLPLDFLPLSSFRYWFLICFEGYVLTPPFSLFPVEVVRGSNQYCQICDCVCKFHTNGIKWAYFRFRELALRAAEKCQTAVICCHCFQYQFPWLASAEPSCSRSLVDPFCASILLLPWLWV